MFVMPIISIPVMINFPCALNVYWLTNNMISLVQSRVMKRQAARDYFNIPEMTKWKPEDLPANAFHVSTVFISKILFVPTNLTGNALEILSSN